MSKEPVFVSKLLIFDDFLYHFRCNKSGSSADESFVAPKPKVCTTCNNVY